MVSSNGNSGAQKYDYQDQELEESLGYNMHEFAVRHYDATIGRFVTTDPYEQFDNPYLAMGNNPVVSMDPDGGYCLDANGNQIVCPDDDIYNDFRGNENDHVIVGDEIIINPSSTKADDDATGSAALYAEDGSRLTYDQINWSNVFKKETDELVSSIHKTTNEAGIEFLKYLSVINPWMFSIGAASSGVGYSTQALVTRTTSGIITRTAATTATTASTVTSTGINVVYLSVENGTTVYVGITNNLARRAAQHLATKGINIEPLMKGLSRIDARSVEQALIVIHKLGKNGGTLLNKINSISPKNPNYANQLRRGYELLKSIGYKF